MIHFIGDIHGEFTELARRLRVRKIRNSHLVQVGDFGLGFGDKKVEEQAMEALNTTLKAGNNLLYVIRGNHDDPNYFQERQEIGNIHLLPDYSVIDLGGYTLLLAGGAISIDRTVRIEGKSYWRDERFVFDPIKLETALTDVKKIDIVVTHNAPSEFWPYEFGSLVEAYARRDANLISDLTEERGTHSTLLKYVTTKFSPSHWYYGHFHAIVDSRYKDIHYHVLGEMHIVKHLKEIYHSNERKNER